MNAPKTLMIFWTLCLVCSLHLSNALQCKVCGKKDPSCVSGDSAEVHTCDGSTDECFSWFDRKGSTVGIMRGCISVDSKEYKAMKKLIESHESGCVKSVNSLDCFSFCSLDNCN